MTTPPLSPTASSPSGARDIEDTLRSRRRVSAADFHPAPVTPSSRHQRAASETALVRYRQSPSPSPGSQSPSSGRLPITPRVLHTNNRNFSPTFLGLRAFWTRLSTTFESVPEHVPGSPVTKAPMFAASSAQAQAGPDLEELQTEAVGFLSIAGETRLRLLPSAWPTNALPNPTSSLMSIASRQGLLAAAGPEVLVIGSTSAVRDAFIQDGPAENNIKNFTPQLTISIPRVSQVAFSADESTLTICADEGGGLAVYDVQALKQGNTQSAFQISTNGISVRCLVPNPSEENAHIVALVLAKGQLMLANLKERQLMNGSNGPVLREGVSSVTWSVKGKQLIAGLGNGAAVQMTPDGAVKAEIPRPPQLEGDQHISAISWLTNDIFLFIYTPSNFEMDHAPDSTFILATRQPKTSNFTFQKLADPCPPFGMNRSPPYHFIQRLREFPPSLSDVLFLSSTAAGDIGLIMCSQKPLSGDSIAVQAASANAYMTTGLAADSRRAQLPVNEEMSDTSPIGVALDLSSTGKVKRPIPGEEIEETATPLPNLMVLNNEGVLSSWWFVYSDSVRQGTAFPGLVAAAGQPTQNPTVSNRLPSGFGGLSTSNTNGFAKAAVPAFGVSGGSMFGSSFGSTSAPASKLPVWGSSSSTNGGSTLTSGSVFGKPFGSGTATNAPAFGQSSFGSAASPAFGSSTPLGGSNAVAASGTASSFGASKPAFGSATALGATGGFGAVGGLGKNTSPWAAGDTQNAPESAINKPADPFRTAANASTGFGAFADKSSGFGSLGTSTTSAISGFGSAGQASTAPLFGAKASVTAPQPGQTSIFGSGGKLGSSAVPSFGAPSNLGTAKAWGASSDSNTFGAGLFGRTATPTQEKDDDMMDDGTPVASAPPSTGANSVEFSQGLNGTAGGFVLNSSFKAGAASKPEAAKLDGNNFMGTGFGQALQLTQTDETPSTPIKQEPVTTPRLEEPSTTPASVPPQPSKLNTGIFGVGPGSQKMLFPPVAATADSGNAKVDAASIVPEPAPLPPSPQLSASTVVPEPAPLPPSPKLGKAQDEDYSPAGSPPVDLGAPGDSPLSSTRSITSEEGLVDDAPLPPDFVSQPTSSTESTKVTESPQLPSIPGPGTSKVEPSLGAKSAPMWSFPKLAAPAQLSIGGSVSGIPSPTPASATKPPMLFQPPTAGNNSPRSPSPVRNQQAVGKNLSGFPSPTRGTSQLFSSTPTSTPSLKPSSRIAVAPPSPLARQMSLTTARAEPGPDASYLNDDEDERIRAELAETVKPTKRLEPFIAHQDYVGKVAGQGVPAQIEKVYRDINSMIDTLGLNARSLNAFIMGHSEMFADGGREKEHLEKEDDWCLIEIEDLAIVQKDISTHLDAERPQDVGQKITELQALQKELIGLRARNYGIQMVLRERSNPEELSTSRFASVLSPEQSAVLGDLRKQFSSLQKNLAKAEDAASLLAAKLAAREVGPGTGRAVPTVEAVVNTISKMTRMAEQKRGDLDVIEHQMRRLRFRPGAATFEDLDIGLEALSLGESTGNRDGSVFATPPSSRTNKTPGTYQLSYEDDTPSASPSPAREKGFRSSLTASARARARQGDTRANVSEEDIDAFKARRERRKNVLGVLRKKIAERDGAEQQ